MFGLFKKTNPIKKGDIIICIDDRNWNGSTNIELVYNKKYQVLDILNYKNCTCYDIGGRFLDPQTHTTDTSLNILLPGRGIHWAGDFRFRKATPDEVSEYNKEQSKEIQTKIDSLVAIEDYEEAAKLQKLIEK